MSRQDETESEPARPAWPQSRREALGLAAIVLVTAAAAVVGGAATGDAVAGWYQDASRPAWTPPDWVFGPVWTFLYASMAFAAWLVWRTPPSTRRSRGLMLYGGQLVLNALWSILFFGWQAIGAALIEILVLLAAILATMWVFWHVDRRAGILFVPYAAWVAYATSLNAGFWWLAQ